MANLRIEKPSDSPLVPPPLQNSWRQRLEEGAEPRGWGAGGKRGPCSISHSVMNTESNQNEIAGDSILQRGIQNHLSLTGAKGRGKKKKAIINLGN